MRFTLQDVVDATGGRLVAGDPRRPIRGVSTDSRTLERDQLFLALSGPNHDGNRFATEAGRRGAAALCLRGDESSRFPELPAGLPVVVCEEPRRALADLAAWHRSRITAPVVGITGSCGKTTVKDVLLELVAGHRRAVGSPSSFNNDVGVPLTLLLAEPAVELLVVEIGTNAPGEVARLARIARPTAGIVTNVGASHLEGLGSVAGVAAEKSDLLASLPGDGFAVVNRDCRFADELLAACTAPAITFSVEGEGELNATDLWFHPGGTTFRLDGLEVSSPLLGTHNVHNLLAALAACRGLGLELQAVLPAVSRLRAARRRMERVDLGEIALYDDTYNANPESARAGVRVLAGQHGYARKVLVLGDMLELGPRAPELHHAVGRDAAAAGLDLLVLVGELARAGAAGALEGGLDPSRVVHFEDVAAAERAVPDLVKPGDVVLVKASRRTGLERVVEAIRRRWEG